MEIIAKCGVLNSFEMDIYLNKPLPTEQEQNKFIKLLENLIYKDDDSFRECEILTSGENDFNIIITFYFEATAYYECHNDEVADNPYDISDTWSYKTGEDTKYFKDYLNNLLEKSDSDFRIESMTCTYDAVDYDTWNMDYEYYEYENW